MVREEVLHHELVHHQVDGAGNVAELLDGGCLDERLELAQAEPDEAQGACPPLVLEFLSC
jgi:hypothetical protein